MLSIWLKRVLGVLIILGMIGRVFNGASQSGGSEDPAVVAGAIVGRILLLALAVWLFVSAHRASKTLKMQRLQAGQHVPQQTGHYQPLPSDQGQRPYNGAQG